MAVALALLAGCGGDNAAHVQKGQRAAKRGDFAEAARHFRAAVRTEPGSALLFYNLGMAEFKAGNLDKAAAALERATELQTEKTTEEWEALAAVRLRQKQWNKASKAFDAAIANAGRLPRLLAGWAAADAALGNSEFALKLLCEALTTDRDEPAALYNMAYILHHDAALRDEGAAVRYYRQFLRKAPENESDYAAKREEAQAAIDALRGVRPAISRRAEELVIRSRQTGDRRQAIVLALQACNEDPLSEDALWNYASRLNDALEAKVLDDPVQVRAAYLRFIELYPDDARVGRVPEQYLPKGMTTRYLEQARTARKNRQYAEALSFFQKAAEVNPRAASIWREYAECAILVGTPASYVTAQNAAMRVLEIDPSDAMAQYYYGVSLYNSGAKKPGMSWVKKYLRSAPDSPHRRQVEEWVKKNGG